MAGEIQDLDTLSWRGLPAPDYTVVSFEWQNELAPRGVPYVDVDVHDNVRRKSASFKARIYFCETLTPGAFTQQWKKWLPAIKDGSADYLVHPLLGTLRARVQHVGGEVAAHITDGIVIDVSWVETNEDPSTLNADLSASFDIASLTQVADQNATAVGVPYPTGQGTTSIFQAFQSIRGQIFSAEVSVAGAIDATLANVEAMIDIVSLQDATSWAAYDSLINVWNALTDLKAKIATTARATASKTIAFDTTLDAFAAEVGNDLKDVMGLNLEALRTPLVPKGSTLRYFTAA